MLSECEMSWVLQPMFVDVSLENGRRGTSAGRKRTHMSRLPPTMRCTSVSRRPVGRRAHVSDQLDERKNAREGEERATHR